MLPDESVSRIAPVVGVEPVEAVSQGEDADHRRGIFAFAHFEQK
jgi:hypothetical protein